MRISCRRISCRRISCHRISCRVPYLKALSGGPLRVFSKAAILLYQKQWKNTNRPQRWKSLEHNVKMAISLFNLLLDLLYIIYYRIPWINYWINIGSIMDSLDISGLLPLEPRLIESIFIGSFVESVLNRVPNIAFVCRLTAIKSELLSDFLTSNLWLYNIR